MYDDYNSYNEDDSMGVDVSQQILMRATNMRDGREAFLLFEMTTPDEFHRLQRHCSLVNAFCANPNMIANIQLGNTLVIEGPGDFSILAAARLKEILGKEWQVQLYKPRQQ